MRGDLLLSALILLGGEAMAATHGAGGPPPPDVKPEGRFDLVSASLATTTNVSEITHKYISNPVCLFGATGPECDAFPQGAFLSLPYGDEVRALPLTLRFAFDGAVENLSHLSLRVSGPGVSATSANMLPSLTLRQTLDARGRTNVEIENFYIPPMHLEPFAGQVTLTLEVTAKAGNEENTEAVAVSLGGPSAAVFTPTFSTNRMDPTNYRFSGRDEPVGYDFWATYETIQWLSSRTNFWVNDFSALHSARYGAGRSILNHSTHHDGRTIDLRYASGLDDDGNFVLSNECLAGAPCARADGILHMLALAAEAPSDEQNKAPERQDARVRAQEWIDANRQLLNQVAADAREIYVGRGPIYEALVLGANGGRRLLASWAPGAPTYIREWTAHRKVVHSSPGHDDHWHIALR